LRQHDNDSALEVRVCMGTNNNGYDIE